MVCKMLRWRMPIASAARVIRLPLCQAACRAMSAAGAVDPFGHPGQAEGYAVYRPWYPETLLEKIWGVTDGGKRTLAVDVCCGTGRISAPLASRFDRVLAFDRSEEQLRHADRTYANVVYQCGDVAMLGDIVNEQADLITIAQGLHWLDIDAFCGMALASLRPFGCLAVLGYAVCELSNEAADRAFKDYYYGTLGSGLEVGSVGSAWGACDRRALDSGFATVNFPLERLERIWHRESTTMSVHEFMAYLRTWSGYHNYLAQGHANPLPELESRLDAAAGEARILDVTFPYFLVMGRRCGR
eukprot:NODE_14852_length_1081_cov_10.699161.p1 GENE.NODE_14852_length_1081_cov_10.699161~~NODE_14852_length_1081_cov_10.699161.p1  ORF type:complete len:300 (-),score=62.91 NODE_14852_length_1081_cov_10.699161:132-1031(-)